MAERAAGDENWRVFPVALGASPGRQTLFVTESTQLASLRRPDTRLAPEFAASSRLRDETLVEVSTVDEMLASHDGSNRRIYLKMDTQGFDQQVFEGARNSLPRIRALQTEVSFVPLYRDAPLFHEWLPALIDKGFELSGMFANNEGHFPRLIEMDAFLVNRD